MGWLTDRVAEMEKENDRLSNNAAATATAMRKLGHDYMKMSHLDGCRICRELSNKLLSAPQQATELTRCTCGKPAEYCSDCVLASGGET